MDQRRRGAAAASGCVRAVTPAATHTRPAHALTRPAPFDRAEAERRGPKPINCSGAPVDTITGAYMSGAQGASLAQQDAAAAAAAAIKRQEAAKRGAGAGYNLLTGEPGASLPAVRRGLPRRI